MIAGVAGESQQGSHLVDINDCRSDERVAIDVRREDAALLVDSDPVAAHWLELQARPLLQHWPGSMRKQE
jgi:hypothetical protein